MLHLVNSNKGGLNFKGISAPEIHWKSIFKTSEDSLTSSVFGLLFYLPTELFWTIIRNACYSDGMPNGCGNMIGFEFWPRWDNENETQTEPDIFIQFEDFDLIVEAKRYDYDQQYEDQWKAEINAYYLLRSESKRKVYLLAIGGIRRGEENDSTLTYPDVERETTVFKSRWRKLLGEITKVHKKLIKSPDLLTTCPAINNILNDLVLSFRIHGFVTSDLLNTLPTAYSIRTKATIFGESPFKKIFTWNAFIASYTLIDANSITTLLKPI